MGGFKGGVQGVATAPPLPPKCQSHSAKCNTTYVLIYVEPLIYVAKRLVVVVVSSVQAVKLLSTLAVVHSEVLHLLKCQLGLNPVLKLSTRLN